jgi:Spy/CpxP family protein refolding chaperone
MADSRMRLWFALFVLAVFCLGGAVGMFIGARMDRFDRPGRLAGSIGPGPGGGPRGGPGGGPPPDVLIERLTRELDLDATQRDQIGAVLKASRERVGVLQREVRTQFDDEQRTLREEIRKVLTPEQQERFDQSLERGRRGRGRGPGRQR